MRNKYSLLENLYQIPKRSAARPLRENKYSLRSLLLETAGAGIDAQAKVGTWVLETLNKTNPNRYWGFYVDGGNFPDVRIYDSQDAHSQNPNWHKCVLQIEVKDGTTMDHISVIKGEEDEVATGIFGWLEAKKSMYDSKYIDPETEEESNMWFGNMVAGEVKDEISSALKNDGLPMEENEAGEMVRKEWTEDDLFKLYGSKVKDDPELFQKLQSHLLNAIEWVKENHPDEQGYTMIHGHYDAPWDPVTGETSNDFRWVKGSVRKKGVIEVRPATEEEEGGGGLWTGSDKEQVLRRMQSKYGAKKAVYEMNKAKTKFKYRINPETNEREKIFKKWAQGQGYPLAAIMVINDGSGEIQGKWYDFPGAEQREDYLKQNADFGKTPEKGLSKHGRVGSTKMLSRESYGSYTPAEGELFDTMMHRHLEHENETHYAVVKGNSMYIAEVGTSDSVLNVGKAVFDDSPMIQPGSSRRQFINDRNVTRENFYFTMSGGEHDSLPANNSSEMFPYSGNAGKIAAGLEGAHTGYGEKPGSTPDGE